MNILFRIRISGAAIQMDIISPGQFRNRARSPIVFAIPLVRGVEDDVQSMESGVVIPDREVDLGDGCGDGSDSK